MRDPVGELKRDRDVGIGGEETRRHRQHVQPAEHRRRGDDEVAPGLRVLARGGALGFANLLEDRPRGRDVGSPRRRELEALGGADQQIGVQGRSRSRSATLRLTVASGSPSFWLAQPRQAAALDNRQQHGHGVQTVHGLPVFEQAPPDFSPSRRAAEGRYRAIPCQARLQALQTRSLTAPRPASAATEREERTR